MVEGPLSLAARIHALDSEDMFGHVSRFVDDLEAAFSAVNERTCPGWRTFGPARGLASFALGWAARRRVEPSFPRWPTKTAPFR